MSRKPKTVRPSKSLFWIWLGVALLGGVGASFLLLSKKTPASPAPETAAPSAAPAPISPAPAPVTVYTNADREVYAAYAGSESCRACHAAEFVLFQNSHHALAERPVSAEQDARFFAPAQSIKHGSQTSQAHGAGKEFFLKTLGGKNVAEDFPLERVIGVAPLRQFLTRGEKGRWQVMEVAADPAKGDWFNIFGDEDRHPGEWGHWSGRGMNWNSMCATCHNTRVRKNYDPATDTYTTAMAESTVSCEACHGPMKAHVDWQKTSAASGQKDPTIKRVGREAMFSTCGSCHSRRAELTGDFTPGDQFLDHHLLTIPDETDIFHADGQIRDEDYEFTSFLGSKMAHANVRCVDCHEPHSAKTRDIGNALCLRCHGAPIAPAPKIDPAAHGHHVPGQPGGNCVDCHMPQTTYMQRHARRDHGFIIPDPLLTKTHQIPNACNRCHEDKGVDWQIAAVEKWYGPKMDRFTRRRAQVIAETRTGTNDTSDRLLALWREEKIPLWRAAEIGLLRNAAAQPKVMAALLASANDTNALVRAAAARALEGVADANASVSTTLRSLMQDPVRAVRVEAAWSGRRQPEAGDHVDLLRYLQHNSDQPSGLMQSGAFHLERGETATALTDFRRAASWDTQSAPIQHALAMALSSAGENAETITVMEKTCALAPQNPEYRFHLGLALGEGGRNGEAVKAFQEAVRLDPQYAQAWYNLGLLQAQTGADTDALASLSRAEAIEPQQARYPYARATVLARLGRREEARAAAELVLRLQPGNQAAAALLRQLQ